MLALFYSTPSHEDHSTPPSPLNTISNLYVHLILSIVVQFSSTTEISGVAFTPVSSCKGDSDVGLGRIDVSPSSGEKRIKRSIRPSIKDSIPPSLHVIGTSFQLEIQTQNPNTPSQPSRSLNTVRRTTLPVRPRRRPLPSLSALDSPHSAFCILHICTSALLARCLSCASELT